MKQTSLVCTMGLDAWDRKEAAALLAMAGRLAIVIDVHEGELEVATPVFVLRSISGMGDVVWTDETRRDTTRFAVSAAFVQQALAIDAICIEVRSIGGEDPGAGGWLLVAKSGDGVRSVDERALRAGGERLHAFGGNSFEEYQASRNCWGPNGKRRPVPFRTTVDDRSGDLRRLGLKLDKRFAKLTATVRLDARTPATVDTGEGVHFEVPALTLESDDWVWQAIRNGNTAAGIVRAHAFINAMRFLGDEAVWEVDAGRLVRGVGTEGREALLSTVRIGPMAADLLNEEEHDMEAA